MGIGIGMKKEPDDLWNKATLVCKRCAASRNLDLAVDLVQRVEETCDICGVWKTVYEIEDFESKDILNG